MGFLAADGARGTMEKKLRSAESARTDFGRRCSSLAAEKAELAGIIERLEADLAAARSGAEEAAAKSGAAEAEIKAAMKQLRQELADAGVYLLESICSEHDEAAIGCQGHVKP